MQFQSTFKNQVSRSQNLTNYDFPIMNTDATESLHLSGDECVMSEKNGFHLLLSKNVTLRPTVMLY